jgi:hypothetical protein
MLVGGRDGEQLAEAEGRGANSAGHHVARNEMSHTWYDSKVRRNRKLAKLKLRMLVKSVGSGPRKQGAARAVAFL